MPVSYYIYYRVRPEDMQHARAAVTTIQLSLRAETGIQGRLLRRGDDECTWMEIYEAVADTGRFEAILGGLVEEYGLGTCLQADSRRHIERFIPL